MDDLQIRSTGTTIQTDVLIIGAGPTGLALACQFVRYGVDFVIIEKHQGVTPYSKALGVHARTLEIYEQLGLAQSAVAQGAIAGKMRLLKAGKVRAGVNLSNLGQGLSPYPYVLFLEQSKNEQLLYDFLKQNGKTVHWQTELEHFSQTVEKVTAQVKTADGISQRIEANYLVGCDGSKSLVRHTLGLEFSGSTFERVFYVADARITWNLDHDGAYVCLSKDSLLVFFPLKGSLPTPSSPSIPLKNFYFRYFRKSASSIGIVHSVNIQAMRGSKLKRAIACPTFSWRDKVSMTKCINRSSIYSYSQIRQMIFSY
jgi:2-polyprenyl-6-methoxyphenol hydroxylase-like FAD-dependent oxidoreductase